MIMADTAGTLGNPFKPINDKLSNIENLLKGFASNNNSSNAVDFEIKSIKTDMSSISRSMKEIVKALKSETEEVRKQKQKEMEENIIKGVNTHMDNVSDAINSFNTTLDEKQKTIRFSAELSESSKSLLQETNRIFSKNSYGSLLSEVKSDVSETVNGGKNELNECAKQAKSEVKDASKRLKDEKEKAVKEVKDTISWFRWIGKNKIWTVITSVAFMLAFIAVGVNSCQNGNEKAAAAEQVINDANYWDVYEYYAPKHAAWLKENYDSLQKKRTDREAINYIDGGKKEN